MAKKFNKTKKPLSGIIFSQNGMRQVEDERKKFQYRIEFILDQGKKIPKKITKKLKKSLSRFIFSQNWMVQAEKERKKYQSRIPFILDQGKKIRKKKSKKIQKIRKHNFGIISIQNGWRESKNETKKILVLNSIPTLARQGYSEKNRKKI